MRNQTNAVRRMAGYTIDQTILIVAVIAILITLVIASVGWDILTRAGGAKLASNLRQIEDSTGLFYSDAGGIWPEEADDLSRGNLTSDNTIGSGKNYVPGFDDSATATMLDHQFGSGGTIELVQQTNTAGNPNEFCPGSELQTFISFVLTNVPTTEIEQADESVDGGDGRTAGRLRWTNVAGANQTVTYCANQL